MRIAEVTVFPTRLPFRTTFKISRGAVGSQAEGAPHIYVRVTADDGTVGWGEARPSHRWSYETEESVVTTLRRYLGPAVVGLDAFDLEGAHAAMDHEIAPANTTGQPIARSGLDMALHDLMLRKLGISLRSHLGATAAGEVRLSYLVTAEDPEQAGAAAAQARAAGYEGFKVKIGLTPERDVEVVAAVKEEARHISGGLVWADANQAYTASAAVKLARQLAEVGADVLEQPVPANDYAGLLELRRLGALPIAADESVFSAADFVQLWRLGVIDWLVIKVSKLGGLRAARRCIEFAREAGVELLGSGLTESALGFIASAQLYSALGVKRPVDLNGPQFLDGDPAAEPVALADGKVRLTGAPGVGPAPDPDRLEEWRTESLGEVRK